MIFPVESKKIKHHLLCCHFTLCPDIESIPSDLPIDFSPVF
jgi:hypothetical protein